MHKNKYIYIISVTLEHTDMFMDSIISLISFIHTQNTHSLMHSDIQPDSCYYNSHAITLVNMKSHSFKSIIVLYILIIFIYTWEVHYSWKYKYFMILVALTVYTWSHIDYLTHKHTYSLVHEHTHAFTATQCTYIHSHILKFHHQVHKHVCSFSHSQDHIVRTT